MTEKTVKWIRLHPAPRQQEQGIYQYVYDEFTVLSDDVIIVDGYEELAHWLEQRTEDLGEWEWSDGRLVRFLRLLDSKDRVFAQFFNILDKSILDELWA